MRVKPYKPYINPRTAVPPLLYRVDRVYRLCRVYMADRVYRVYTVYRVYRVCKVFKVCRADRVYRASPAECYAYIQSGCYPIPMIRTLYRAIIELYGSSFVWATIIYPYYFLGSKVLHSNLARSEDQALACPKIARNQNPVEAPYKYVMPSRRAKKYFQKKEKTAGGSGGD